MRFRGIGVQGHRVDGNWGLTGLAAKEFKLNHPHGYMCIYIYIVLNVVSPI